MYTNDTDVYRHFGKMPSIKLTVEETFELSKDEYEKLPIWHKFPAIWNQKYIDLSVLKYSYIFGLLLFVSIWISEFYILRNYVIITLIETHNKRYWCKVGCFYMWYIVMAHWLCILTYNSYWISEDKDQPSLKNKKLWNDYDESLKLQEKKRIIDTSYKMTSNHNKRMLDYYLPDEDTGLQWKFCIICQRDSPPRTHHCVICNKCILKRDHHCFITGRCIGYYNQRYFYFLCLFSLLNSLIGLVFEGYYLFYYSSLGLNSQWSHIFIPKSIYMWLWTSELETNLMIIIIHLHIFPLVAAMCFGFFCLQTITIIKGVTSEEFKQAQNVKVNLSILERWQDVFGECWLLNFFIPSQILFKQKGDGISWPGVINLNGLIYLRHSK